MWVFVCQKQDINNVECFLVLISVFADIRNIWMDVFFLPSLLECLCGHRQLMKRTKERQCCKIIRKEKEDTVQANAFCYYNAIFSLVCSSYCSLHWLFTGDKKFIKWLFILQYQYVLSQIVYSLPLIFFKHKAPSESLAAGGLQARRKIQTSFLQIIIIIMKSFKV